MADIKYSNQNADAADVWSSVPADEPPQPQHPKQAQQAPSAVDNVAFLAHCVTCSPGNFYHANGYRPDDSVAYLMRRIICLISQAIEREMEPSGLTNAQWVPLLKLHMGLACTVAELARECDLDAGSMTRLLDRLEAKQLIRRLRSSSDRRVVNIELTPSGCKAASEIPDILCRVQNAHLAGFSTDEWQNLKFYLRRVLTTAHAIQANATKLAPIAI